MTAPENPIGTGTVSARDSVSAEPQKSGTLELVGFLGRWILGAVFIYMGLSKALQPEDFLNLVRQYQLTTNPIILNSIAAALPWFEALCGLLLLAGIAVRGTALVSVLLLVPFTLVIFKRALALAALNKVPFTTIKFDCGCGAGEVVIWHKLIENGLLVLLGIWLIAGYGRSWSIRYCLFRERKRPPEPEA